MFHSEFVLLLLTSYGIAS